MWWRHTESYSFFLSTEPFNCCAMEETLFIWLCKSTSMTRDNQNQACSIFPSILKCDQTLNTGQNAWATRSYCYIKPFPVHFPLTIIILYLIPLLNVDCNAKECAIKTNLERGQGATTRYGRGCSTLFII